jgi:RNA polymerase sigma factor (TIGR02999 family)
MEDVTRIFGAICQGDPKALDELFPLVYEELRSMAAQRLEGESPGNTLQATALVHEAYLRLVGPADVAWENRGHFFGAAAEAMRRILIDRARAKHRVKRGAGAKRLDLTQLDLACPVPSEELLALDEALQRLEQQDSKKAQLVKLRFFAGMTTEQSARVLGISRATAERYWSFARAWLYHELVAGDVEDAGN